MFMYLMYVYMYMYMYTYIPHPMFCRCSSTLIAQTCIQSPNVLQVPEYIAQLTASINHAATLMQKGAAAGDATTGMCFIYIT